MCSNEMVFKILFVLRYVGTYCTFYSYCLSPPHETGYNSNKGVGLILRLIFSQNSPPRFVSLFTMVMCNLKLCICSFTDRLRILWHDFVALHLIVEKALLWKQL